MLKKIGTTIIGNALFAAGDVVVVAVSGGADSVALLDVLVRQEQVPVRLVVAHLHHGLRGAEADADEEFVRTLAEGYGITFVSRKVDVGGLAKRLRLSIEEAGRDARYSFLADVASAYGARVVALAHHRDDQAETVLMRLLRGTGGSGLTGMQLSSADGRFVRPLLSVTRAEVEKYLAGRGLHYRTDSSNSDTRFLRNRVRHELIPTLGSYNPQVVARLTATALSLAEDEAVLVSLTEQAFRRLAECLGERVTLGVTDLLSEPKGLRVRLYRHAIREVQGNLARISFRHLEAVDALVTSAKPQGDLNLPGRVVVKRRYGHLTCSRQITADPIPLSMFLVPGPGEYPLSGGRLLLVSERKDFDGANCADRVFFDLEKAPFPWQVRFFQPGDRIKPVGMTGSKKLKDLFIDAKLPREVRKTIPLVWSEGKLIWVCGLRQSREALPSSGTKVSVAAEILDITH